MAQKLHQIRAKLEETRTRRKQNLAQMHHLQSSSTSGQPVTTDQQNYLSQQRQQHVIPSHGVQGSADRNILSKQVMPLSGTWAVLYQNNRI